jgi:hypothetical protein
MWTPYASDDWIRERVRDTWYQTTENLQFSFPTMTQTPCRQRLNFKALRWNYCPTHGAGTLPTCRNYENQVAHLTGVLEDVQARHDMLSATD